jgi:hypothetical protein
MCTCASWASNNCGREKERKNERKKERKKETLIDVSAILDIHSLT